MCPFPLIQTEASVAVSVSVRALDLTLSPEHPQQPSVPQTQTQARRAGAHLPPAVCCLLPVACRLPSAESTCRLLPVASGPVQFLLVGHQFSRWTFLEKISRQVDSLGGGTRCPASLILTRAQPGCVPPTDSSLGLGEGAEAFSRMGSPPSSQCRRLLPALLRSPGLPVCLLTCEWHRPHLWAMTTLLPRALGPAFPVCHPRSHPVTLTSDGPRRNNQVGPHLEAKAGHSCEHAELL